MTNAQSFENRFGTAPAIIASAPGRVNLIGEHIDYSDGLVLPFAISYRTYVAIGFNDLGCIRISSNQKHGEIKRIELSEIAPQTGATWTQYCIGTLWALDIFKLLKANQGLDICINGKVPLGAGLSSSAALECAVATAVNELFSLGKSLADLARATQRAENEYVGMPCGIMDQSVSLMANAGSALLLDCRSLESINTPFEIAEAGLELLIIDTQVHHALVDGGYAERRDSCEKCVEILSITSLRDISVEQYMERKSELDEKTYLRGLHAVTEMQRVRECVDALKEQDFAKVGALLNESHRSLRDNYNVSCPELNLAVDTALANGALGARMVGGGFGGSAIALIHNSDIQKLKSAISGAFTALTLQSPRFFTSLPSEGAKVER
jgi:galactokinase